MTKKKTGKLQVTLTEWFKDANRQVTRGDLLRVLTIYERNRRRETVWYRRLWRWFKAPMT